MQQHCFSVDVEGFCEGTAEYLGLPYPIGRSSAERATLDYNVRATLDLLDEVGVTGTFFVLGILAVDQPEIVRAIARRGHEIASHSYYHRRLFSLSSQELRQSIVDSKKALEQCSGTVVRGFRAPEFSISADNLSRVTDALGEAGYTYDSSIFPISNHDVYGVPAAERRIHQLANGVIEFPPSTLQVGKMRFPAAGGGYFRLYPYALTRMIFQTFHRHTMPGMFYIHPYEVGGRVPPVVGGTWLRRKRRFINMGKVAPRIRRLCREFQFTSAIEILQSHLAGDPRIKPDGDTALLQALP
jgi:polysaccharide deacetylase family protein (PEP-CTERM system associated)